MSRLAAYSSALLDFDLTLVDMSDAVDWRSAGIEVRRILVENSFEVSSLDLLPVSLLRESVNFDRGPPGSRRERWMRASGRLCDFEEEGAEKAVANEGCFEFLEVLRSNLITAAVTSSNCRSAIIRCAERLGMINFFSSIVTRDEVLWEMKPNTKPIKMAMKSIGARPENTFGLGDSVVDIRAFSACMVTPFGITGGMSTSDELYDAGAVKVFASLKQAADEFRSRTG